MSRLEMSSLVWPNKAMGATAKKKSESASFKRVNIAESCLELAQFLKETPSDLDRDLSKKGQSSLAVFQDHNYSDSFQNLKELKKDALLMAAEDISKGIITLRSSVIGVSFSLSKLHLFVVPHGTPPDGSVVYSISWKNIRAFQNWRAGEDSDIDQSEINSSLYHLCFLLSKVL